MMRRLAVIAASDRRAQPLGPRCRSQALITALLSPRAASGRVPRAQLLNTHSSSVNASAIDAVARMLERADLLGHAEPGHYLWPACQWGRYVPSKPMLQWDTDWRALRDGAGLNGLRFHDLRHTVITELAEMGVADHVLESISGHLSRRMLEHYSHIRIDAKRQALDALDAARRNSAPNGGGDGSKNNREAPDEGDIDALVEVSDGFTSQSRHSLRLSGSPPSGKLLIPLERRDVRVVEGARLESVCTGNRTVGSNPTLSASLRQARTRTSTSGGIAPDSTPAITTSS